MEPIHPDADAYVRESDVPLLNRLALESLCGAARRVSTGLYLVGASGLLLWLWYVWKTIDGLLDGGDRFGGGVAVFSDGSPTVGDYITAIGQQWILLIFSALVVGAAAALRVVAAHVGNAVGVAVADLGVGDPLSADVAGDEDLAP